ncbi:MAG: discoidin domain-containing protein, partial [bacterium]|nr:discoidin domain-containing protein [bacterium]
TTQEDLEEILKDARARDKKIKELVAKNSVDGYGEAFQLLVDNLDFRRANKENVGAHLWKALKAKDPKDASGWDFALTYNPLEGACYKMQDFAKEHKYAEGEKLLQEMKSKPQAHLSMNQRQGMELLYFVLYRNNIGRRNDCINILKAVAEMDPTTHFGSGALGYLCMWGEGPIAVPYGWREKHVKRGKQTWRVEVGMARAVPKPGRYALTLKRTKGKAGMKVLKVGGKGIRAPEEIYPLEMNKDTEIIFIATQENPTLELTIEAEDPSENEGQIRIHPLLLARRKSAEDSKRSTAKPWICKKGDSIVKQYADVVIADKTIATILRRPKGRAFLEEFFTNEEWMKDFFSAGEPTTTWDNAFHALDAMYYHALSKKKKISRADWRWASAAALNAEEDFTPIVQSYLAMEQIRKERLLVKGMDQLRVDQMRFAFAIKQGNAESMLWIAHAHHVPPNRYGGVCWYAAYRIHNYFGDSIHGSDYYKPWDHIYVRHQTARMIGGVCGSLSHYGCMAARSHGLPATTGGQPAHCAYNVWQPRLGRWEIDYNVGAYTGAHFLPWKNAWSFAYLDLQNELFAAKGYEESMERLWKAEIARHNAKSELEMSPMHCVAYAWTGGKLPTSFDTLEKLGEWNEVDDFSIERLDRKDNICYVWTGEFTLSKSMDVFIQAQSDDGAMLFVDGKHVAGDDGCHGFSGKSSVEHLTKGKHAFELRYFNKGGGRRLQVDLLPREGFDATIDQAYIAAASACPVNLNVWRAYVDWASSCPEKQKDVDYWTTLGRRIAKGMGHHLEPTWGLLNNSLVPKVNAASNNNSEVLKTALIEWHRAARQGEHFTAEFCNYDAILNKHEEFLKKDKALTFPLFEAVLSTQFETSHAFGRVMRWGGKAFLDDNDYATRYVGALNRLLAGKENAGDTLGKYVKESIREASNARNITAFKSLCELQDKLAPKKRTSMTSKWSWKEPFLAGGLLRISSTSQWDRPEAYGYIVDNQTETEACHTGKEKSPWAELMLPGPAEISRVYIMNANNNHSRIVPFVLEVSEDGETWKQVASETATKNEYIFTFPAVKAQYIRLRCTPNGDTFLHIRKFAAFGKKLY